MSEEMKEVPKVLRKSAFAAFIGRTPQYVTKLLKDGRLVMDEAGKRVKVAESLRLMAETRGARDDVAARWTALAGAAIPEASVVAPTPPAGAQAGSGASDEVNELRQSRAEAEARKAAAQADQEEMKAAQMRGDLIPREEVEAALTFVGGAIRGALDLLPDQTAPVVAPVSALDEVHAILQDASRNALEAIGQAITRQRAELAKGAPR
jgi:hypothetical protein